MVNNAGITKDKLLLRMKHSDWMDVIDINLTSMYNVSKHVVKKMCSKRKGRIINVSSIVGRYIGNSGQTNYAASKAGIVGFTKALAREIAPRGIIVNCIAPGWVDTDMTQGLKKEELIERIPLKRVGSPEDIANTALFLALPSTNYITGQAIVVDGGLTA